MRDGRRPEDMQSGQRPEGQRPEGEQDQPQEGDPQGRNEPGGTGRRDPDGGTPPNERDGDAWKVRLPAELRDAAANGQWDRVPPRYRDLVERYYRWLQEQRAAGGNANR